MKYKYIVTSRKNKELGLTVYTVERTASNKRKRTLLSKEDALNTALVKNELLRIEFNVEDCVELLEEKNSVLLER